jgi:hypothetical protein
MPVTGVLAIAVAAVDATEFTDADSLEPYSLEASTNSVGLDRHPWPRPRPTTPVIVLVKVLMVFADVGERGRRS